MEPAIEIRQLTKRYGTDHNVLDHLDLEIPRGILFGLIGPNGAGKSTLIGILTGLLDFSEGEITINGLALSRVNELQIKKQIASVLQPPLLFENLTSYEFLNYVCEMYGIEPAGLDVRIQSLAGWFELSGFLHARISRLSSGNRKKLAFCGAVLTEPSVLFLDEPFESVDVISISRMKSLLRRLREKGCTVFITSHILEVVENLCDELAILHEGRIRTYLDAQTWKETEKNTPLSRIFEQAIGRDSGDDDGIGWL